MLYQNNNSAKDCQVKNLQKQTAYGLHRAASGSQRDASKGITRKSGRASANSSAENPMALRDRDLNKSGSHSRISTKDQSSKKAPKVSVTRVGSQSKVSGNQKGAKSSSKPRSPYNNQAVGRASLNKSPATTSIQSSGKKTPCISALARQSVHNSISSQQQPNLWQTGGGAYQQQPHQSLQKSASRYEDENECIAEVEHDGSSFLNAEREANEVMEEEQYDGMDRSPMSSNFIGAHLVNRKDLYPFCGGSAFQTPKPLRDDINAGYKSQSTQQSPMTSQRRTFQTSSNIQPKRLDMLQMSQQTTVTNKKIGQNARINYEHQRVSPDKENAASRMTTISPGKKSTTSQSPQKIDESSRNLGASFQQNRQKRQSSGKKRNMRYESNQASSMIDQISGLALNVRKQTSPEHELSQSPQRNYDQEQYSPQQEHTPQVMFDQQHQDSDFGRRAPFVVVANANQVENSYDHDHATRLIDDYSGHNVLSPQSSAKKQLNPYHNSADRSGKRLTSSGLRGRSNLTGQSPGGIKLEPVQMVPTTAFDQQRQASPAKQDRAYKSPNKQKSQSSASPVKEPAIMASATGRRGAVLSNLQINTITEESPETGNAAVAQSMYENLKLLEMQSRANAQEDQYMDEMCATISASDISVAMHPETSSQKKRPNSSNGGVANAGPKLSTRRSREQRKTPTGRKSSRVVQELIGHAKQSGAKRTKYTNTSASTANQQIRAETSPSKHEQRQRSSSNHRKSGGPISAQEQMRLANLERAREYGNRQSSMNKSGISRQSSPVKQSDVRNGGLDSSPCEKQYSPVKPEILSANDLSMTMQGNSQPMLHNDNSVTKSGQGRKSVTRLSGSGSVSKRQKREIKMSKPAQQAKIEFLKKHNCAKKIQRNFRGYLDRQATIEQELAAEEHRQAQFRMLNEMAARIQRAFKAHMCRTSFYYAVLRRQRLKMIVTDLVTAWKTRRSLNCLGHEVQEFVNCENQRKRFELRSQFHQLFHKVIRNKLYLEANFDKLQKVRQQVIAKAQNAKAKKQNGPNNCAMRVMERQIRDQQHTSMGSPFKKPTSSSPSKPHNSRHKHQIGSSSPQRCSPQKGSNFNLHNMHGTSDYQSNAHVNNSSSQVQAMRQTSSAVSQPRQQRENVHQPQSQTYQSNRSNKQQPNPSHQMMKPSNHRLSTGSIGSGRCKNEDVFNAQRNSFDNQAMCQLKDFIQNSGKKNESYCSIRVTSGPKEQSIKVNNGKNKGNTSLREGSNGPKDSHSNSKVLIKVHNGSFQDLISPPQPKQSSESQQQVNIMLGSCTRFSHKKLLTTDAVEENEFEEVPNQNAKTTISKFDQRKASQESGTEYRQSLKRVRPRVDCWNRSATRGEATPNSTSANVLRTIEPPSSNQIDMSYNDTGPIHDRPSAYKGTTARTNQGMGDNTSAVGLKTPVQRIKRNQGVMNTSAISQSTSNFVTSNNVQHATGRNHQHSGASNQHRKMHSTTQNKSADGMPDMRAKSSNQMNTSCMQIRRRPSMLREPTKFTTGNGSSQKDVQIKRIGGDSNMAQSRAVTPNATVSSRLERLSRPKNYQPNPRQQQPEQSQNQSMSGTNLSQNNLRQFVNMRGDGGAPVPRRQAATARPTPPPLMQTQIFEMRENLANITQLMESVAAEADANQKQKAENKAGAFGLNSQYRATIKNLQAQEKNFYGLLRDMEEQFTRFRDLAVPSNPNANADLA